MDQNGNASMTPEQDIARWNIPCKRPGPNYCTGLVLAIFGGEILHGFLAQSRFIADSKCTADEKALGLALSLYEQDWDGRMPPAPRWAESATIHYSATERKQAFRCREAETPFSYVFNSRLDRVDTNVLNSTADTIIGIFYLQSC